MIADQSIGATDPSFVSSKPPAGDLAFWVGAQSTFNMFTLNGPAGLIVEVKLVVTGGEIGAAQAVSRTITGATVGAIYQSVLDGAGGLLVPPAGNQL